MCQRAPHLVYRGLLVSNRFINTSHTLHIHATRMPYRYRAATPAGRVVEGVIDAASVGMALEALRRQQLTPVDVTDADLSVGRGRQERGVGRAAALALATRTLAALLGAGVALDRALAFAAEQASNAEVAAAFRQVRSEVQSGLPLADACRRQPRVFGGVYAAMIAAGEEGGALDQAASRLADHLDEAGELRATVRSALLYPLLMALVSALGIMVLLLVVVPRFVTMLGDVGGTLPVSTRALVAMSRIVVGSWWVWLPLAALAVVGTRRWLDDPEHRLRWHRARLALPVVGSLEQRYAAARFARTFGLLLRGGTRVVPALRVAGTSVTNLALTLGVEQAAALVSQGRSVADALGNTFPPLVTRLLAVGEESGQLDALALRAADAYDAEVRRAVRSAVALLEPAMILLFGVIVGFIALAMLQAVYSINASVL